MRRIAGYHLDWCNEHGHPEQAPGVKRPRFKRRGFKRRGFKRRRAPRSFCAGADRAIAPVEQLLKPTGSPAPLGACEIPIAKRWSMSCPQRMATVGPQSGSPRGSLRSGSRRDSLTCPPTPRSHRSHRRSGVPRLLELTTQASWVGEPLAVRVGDVAGHLSVIHGLSNHGV